LKASYHKYILNFKRPSGTSRGIITEKETWFIVLEKDGKKGIGECGILRSLSADDRPDYEDCLQWTCGNIHVGKDALWEALIEFPSIQFGVEMAFKSLESETPFLLFMKQQIEEKIASGFNCIKLKIGAIDFEEELELLRYIRSHFSPEQIEIRVDANGAFNSGDALHKLKQLSEFKLHSIEQPIAKNQIEAMAGLCEKTPLPIALDEELIGVFTLAEKERLLEKIKPQYIIFKPSFIGGFRGTQEWIDLAEKYGIGWWVTSALESNIGLNAIAQWTFIQNSKMPQGLGTGALYTNNFDCPLNVKLGQLWYDKELDWDFSFDEL
jgi:O-succinylbenzoate synthase